MLSAEPGIISPQLRDPQSLDLLLPLSPHLPNLPRSASALLTALSLAATDVDRRARPHLQRPPPLTSPGEPPRQPPCLLPAASDKEGSRVPSDPLHLSCTAASPGTASPSSPACLNLAPLLPCRCPPPSLPQSQMASLAVGPGASY